jgi:hypothetical protein
MEASAASFPSDGNPVTAKIVSKAIESMRADQFTFRRISSQWITNATLVLTAIEHVNVLLSPQLC